MEATNIRKAGLAFFVLLMISSASVFAEASATHRLTYTPNDQPLFSIGFSDVWSISLDHDRITGVSKDGLVWFGTWQVPDVTDFEGATALLDKRLEELFTEVAIERADEIELNEMAGRLYQGTAKQEGKDVVFLVVFFEPKDGAIAVTAFLGDPSAKEIHAVTVTSMVKSLNPQ